MIYHTDLDQRLHAAWEARARDPERSRLLGADLLDEARKSGGDGEIALALLLVAWGELSRSDFGAARAHASEALERSSRCGDLPGRALAMTLLGGILQRLGHLGDALELHDGALALARERGDGALEAMALNGLGRLREEMGEYASAFEHHGRALEIAAGCDADDERASALLGIGNACDQLARYREAIDHYERSLEIAERIGHLQFQAYATGNIGMTHERLGDLATALSYELRSLALKERMGDLWAAGVSLNNIGIIHKSMGRYAPALDALLRSLDHAERIGDRRGEMVALHNIGQVYEALGEGRRVLPHYQRAMTIAGELGDRQGEAFALGHTGRLYAALGDNRQALLHLLKSLRLHQEIDDRYGERSVLESLADLYLERGDLRRAVEYAGRALAIAESTEERRGTIAALVVLGRAELAGGDAAAGIERLRRALREARDAGFGDDLINVARILADAANASGDTTRARKYDRLARDHAARIFNSEETLRARQLIAGFERRVIRDRAETLGLGAEDLDELFDLDASGDISPSVAGEAAAPPAGRGAPSIVVTTFGSLRVEVDGRELGTAAWGRKRARDLFKFLLIHHRRSITIDEIMEKLWDGASDRSTELLVMNAVSRIRKALQPERPARDRHAILASSERTYRLDLGDDAEIDFVRFKELIVMARRSSSAGERALHYEGAVELFTDEFLKGDYDEEWSASERDMLRDAFLEALEYLTGEHLRAGRWEEAGDGGRRILAFDRTSEPGYEALLGSLVGRGRRAEALQVLEECRDLYRRDLASEPPPRLLAIVDPSAL
jgi:DNA-binding SARP family transcriptional activator